MKVIIDKLDIHTDMRGYVFEPIAKEALAAQKNVHLVVSEPEAVRGNHYHRKGTETIAVRGAALVRIREDNSVYDIKVPDGQAYRFIIPPGVSHAIKNTGEHPAILVAFNTEEHRPRQPDLVQDILITP